MAEQLALSLPVDPALDAENFLVSRCNAQAARLIEDWPRWPGRVCALWGPEGGGKTHLAHVWSRKAGALIVPASAVGRAQVSGAAAIEDVDRGGFEETAFFHLINTAREAGFELLLTARTPPGQWPAALPDLRSRFRSLAAVEIGAPDAELLQALLVKHFADRQLAAAPDALAYVARRMERSAAEAARLATLIDAAALSQKRSVTRALARQVLLSLPEYRVCVENGED